MLAILHNVVVCFSISLLPSYSDHRLSHPIVIGLEVSKSVDVNMSVFEICCDLILFYVTVVIKRFTCGQTTLQQRAT